MVFFISYNKNMEKIDYSSDSPISKQEEDLFSRWIFAERIGQIIAKRNDTSSLVVALYGAWGDGKTSVLNFIESSLSSDQNVVCIKFNPWRFTSEEELLEGFFQDIAVALDTKIVKTGEKISELIKRVAPGVAGMFGVEGIGNVTASLITGPSLVELKSRIEQVLNDEKRRLLVLIDDIDRLEKTEIQVMFKIVKLIANFKNTSYLLAFDKDIVATSLQDRYSDKNMNAGESFLEKIIQVPLQLPKIEKNVLREFCFKGVDEALSLSQIELSQTQVQEFVRDFTLAFEDSISTPRKAKLYGNVLMFTLPILKGEVNVVDLMLIEAIRIFCPPLYEVIRNNKDLFTGTFVSNNDYKKENEKIKEIIESALVTAKCNNIKDYICLLESLFPKLKAIYSNTHFGDDWYLKWDQAQRVCSTSYFPRYFTYSIPQNDVSDKLMEEIIEQAKHGSNTDIFEKKLTIKNSEIIIRKLRQKAPLLSSNESKNLALAICKNSHKYLNRETLYNWAEPFVQGAMLVSDLIQNVDKNKRVKFVEECINNTEQIDFKLELFKWLKKENKEKPEQDCFSNKQVSIIGKSVAEAAMNALTTEKDIDGYHKILPAMFYYVKEYIGKTELENFIKKVLKKDKTKVLTLLDTFTPTAFGLETGVSHKSDFDRDQYNRLENLVNPKIILEAIKRYYGKLPEIEKEYQRDYDYKDREVLLKQFIWLHNYVLKESSEKDKTKD